MGFSIWQLIIILAIVLLLFGTKKLKNIGGDIGGAIRSFRSAVREGESESTKPEEPAKVTQQDAQGRVIEGEATKEKEKT
jgi:sec-independent protein translocase protein TatA